MQKVAIVVNNSWYAYNFRFNLARSLKTNGFEVVFVAPYDEKYSELIKKEFRIYDINIELFPEYDNQKDINT